MTVEREAVKMALKEAKLYKRPAPDGVVLVRGDTLTPEPVTWVWPGWVPCGKVALLAGAPGVGKTTVAMAIAATVTIGGAWPDGQTSFVGDVLIWSGEDDPADTLVPRLIGAGADLARVHFVGNVCEGGEERPFDPATDLPQLLEAANGLRDLRLIIVDPIVSAVAGDSHKNTEVRRGLQPLVDFAHAAGAAVLGITHFSKGMQGQDPSQRVTGSVAFTAVARVVIVAAKGQDEAGADCRILARSKSNVGPDEGGFAYALDECEARPGIWATRVAWGEPLVGTARELLAESKNPDDAPSGAAGKAEQFLREALSGPGWYPARKVLEIAKDAGIAEKTLRRAFKGIGGISRKGGMNDGWYWKLPHAEGGQGREEDDEDAIPKTMGNFGIFKGALGIFEVHATAELVGST